MERGGVALLVVATLALLLTVASAPASAQTDVCPISYSAANNGSCDGYMPPAPTTTDPPASCSDDNNSLECVAERLNASLTPEDPEGQPAVIDDSGTGNADCSRGAPCNRAVTYGYRTEVRTVTEYDGATPKQVRYGTLHSLERPASYYDDRELPYSCDSISSAHYAEDIIWDRQATVDACRTEIEQGRESVDDGSPFRTFTPPGDDYTNVEFESVPSPGLCPYWYSAQQGTCEDYDPDQHPDPYGFRTD